MSDTFICSGCGAEHPMENCTLFDGQELCPSCLDEKTTLCDHCGDRIWRDEAEGNDSIILCHYCYENEYVTCTECGVLLPNRDAYYLEDDEETPYCCHCYTEHPRHKAIHEYYYKPEPVFYGDGPRYFGIELEIDEGGELSANAEKLLAIANENHVFCVGALDHQLREHCFCSRRSNRYPCSGGSISGNRAKERFPAADDQHFKSQNENRKS